MSRPRHTAPKQRPANQLLGVLGGMGPAATADFYEKLIAATPATRDQEHVGVLIYADPDIPDRSQAIELGTASTVLTKLRQRADLLCSFGVQAIAIPCNTAHWWLPQLQPTTRVPIISMLEATAGKIRSKMPGASSALVLGTRGTVDSRLYADALSRQRLHLVQPTAEQQFLVSDVIRSVKSGNHAVATRLAASAIHEWLAVADVVVLACSELPVALAAELRERDMLIDPTQALAEACVAWSTEPPDLESTRPSGCPAVLKDVG